jgi:hypothetical protein
MAVEPPAEEADSGHFRWGISPMFGTFFPGPTTVSFGLELRFGYAFNQQTTIYGNMAAVAGVGFGIDSTPGSTAASVSAVTFWQIGPNIDHIIAGPLFVGGGVGVGRAGWGIIEAKAGNGGAGSRTVLAAGFTPSLDGRIGISTGSPNPKTGKRHGFYLALDVRMLIGLNAVETRVEANQAGGTSTVVDDTASIGFAPMLHIGYDQR